MDVGTTPHPPPSTRCSNDQPATHSCSVGGNVSLLHILSFPCILWCMANKKKKKMMWSRSFVKPIHMWPRRLRITRLPSIEGACFRSATRLTWSFAAGLKALCHLECGMYIDFLSLVSLNLTSNSSIARIVHWRERTNACTRHTLISFGHTTTKYAFCLASHVY